VRGIVRTCNLKRGCPLNQKPSREACAALAELLELNAAALKANHEEGIVILNRLRSGQLARRLGEASLGVTLLNEQRRRRIITELVPEGVRGAAQHCTACGGLPPGVDEMHIDSALRMPCLKCDQEHWVFEVACQPGNPLGVQSNYLRRWVLFCPHSGFELIEVARTEYPDYGTMVSTEFRYEGDAGYKKKLSEKQA
jgi:hypothetical protein